jgi:hypothetical protein
MASSASGPAHRLLGVGILPFALGRDCTCTLHAVVAEV